LEYRLHETLRLDQQGKQAIVELLIEKGVDPNITNNHSMTPLHYAAASGNIEMVTFLLAKGAHVNAKGTRAHDWTPLHSAALKGHFSVVELLLKHDAEVNAETQEGETPMGAAMRSDSSNTQEILELLRQYGGIVRERECR
jgi:ankyrin repeat protein